MRQLWPAARARREFEGEIVAYLISWIPRAVWREKDDIDPTQINPYKIKPMTKAMRELNEWRAKRKRQILSTPPGKR